MKKTPKQEVAEKAAEKAGVEALAVHNAAGEYIRTYSALEHGADFVKKAEGYAGKIKGSVRKSG